MYHARLGRFISRDPLDYEDGMSLYEYVRTNPTVHTDVFGTATVRYICWVICPDTTHGIAHGTCTCSSRGVPNAILRAQMNIAKWACCLASAYVACVSKGIQPTAMLACMQGSIRGICGPLAPAITCWCK